MKQFKNIVLLMLFMSVFSSGAYAQVDSLAFQILDNAIGFIFNQGSGAIYYETVAQNVENPLDIFRLPLYQIDKGGHWFMDGNKFEISTAGMKALCDGKLISIIDMDAQTMYVDSIREEPLVAIEDGKKPGYEELIEKEYGEGVMEYLGEEKIKGVNCHKIKANLEKLDGEFTLYWVSKKDNKLVLMAEKAEDLYTVYDIKEIKEVPVNYNYSIVLPNEEIEEFYGLQVFDMRFARDLLSTTGEQGF